MEEHRLAQTVAYGDLSNANPAPITPDYERQAESVINLQLEKAGVRLAYLLDANLMLKATGQNPESKAQTAAKRGNPVVRVWVNTNSGAYHCPARNGFCGQGPGGRDRIEDEMTPECEPSRTSASMAATQITPGCRKLLQAWCCETAQHGGLLKRTSIRGAHTGDAWGIRDQERRALDISRGVFKAAVRNRKKKSPFCAASPI